jgi:hypothetical protein
MMDRKQVGIAAWRGNAVSRFRSMKDDSFEIGAIAGWMTCYRAVGGEWCCASPPSLRAERSNPWQHKGRMDFFVAFAPRNDEEQ